MVPSMVDVSARLQQRRRRMGELVLHRASGGPAAQDAQAEIDRIIAATRSDLTTLPTADRRLRRIVALTLEELRDQDGRR